jgi:hypothetical protein
MAKTTDDTPPAGVIGATTLNRNRFTINCAVCGKKETTRAGSRGEAWTAFRGEGWVAYASGVTTTHVACSTCAMVSE